MEAPDESGNCRRNKFTRRLTGPFPSFSIGVCACNTRGTSVYFALRLSSFTQARYRGHVPDISARGAMGLHTLTMLDPPPVIFISPVPARSRTHRQIRFPMYSIYCTVPRSQIRCQEPRPARSPTNLRSRPWPETRRVHVLRCAAIP